MMFTCPECKAKTLTAEDGWASCSACSYEEAAEQAAIGFCTNVLGMGAKEIQVGQDGHILNCPNCPDENTLVDNRSPGGDDERYLCFCCGETWKSHALACCVECGLLKKTTDMVGEACAGCFRGKVNSDD
ncbi:MAG: hypothetical protein HYV34_04405 [Candidatus Kerfeldbacteria bacterium]|nr:hypothetical protein [Candidatus Kerfeldbacteria bacterium]